jgi:hypothetical protein
MATGAIKERLDTLAAELDKAESNKEVDSELKILGKKLVTVQQTVNGLNGKLSEVADEEMIGAFKDNLAYLVDCLSVGEGIDQESLKAARDRVIGLVQADLLDGKDHDSAIDLIDRFNKVYKVKRAPREGGSPSSSSNEPDFGFPTEAFCETCGEVVAHQGKRSGTTRWAFLKKEAQDHHVAKHGGKFSAEFNAGWKDGKKAMDGGAGSVQCGDYVVRKVS